MSKKLLCLLVILCTTVFIFTGCNKKSVYKDGEVKKVPNPAVEKCNNESGVHSIVKDVDGEKGMCTFNDDSVCEEHKFFRGECKKGDCKKECLYAHTDKEGYYDTCNHELVSLEKCAELKPTPLKGAGRDNVDTDVCLDNDGTYSRIYNPLTGKNELYCVYSDGSICADGAYSCKKGDCQKECRAKGTRSEGWYNSCNGELISYSQCSCQPMCKAVGSKSEGWYNSCTDELIKYTECKEDCKVKCDKVGTRSEGWYDCNNDLIGYDFCGTMDNRNVSQRIEKEDDYIGMPNPAAQKCKDDGYNYVIYKTPFDGEMGYCEFDENNFCEEWAYYNKKCKMNDCQKECLHVRSRSEGWFDSCTDKRLTFSFCGDVK